MKKGYISRVVCFFCTIILLCFLSACNNSIVVKVSSSGIEFEYKAQLGNSLIETLTAVLGYEDSGSGQGQAIFDTESIRSLLQEYGIKNVEVSSVNSNNLLIKGRILQDSNDDILKTGLFQKIKDGSSYSIILTKETLQAFYNNLPSDLRAYIDMFMAPSFTDEKMSDDEYVELIASVYGEGIAKEIKGATFSVALENKDGTINRKQVPLLRILNINEKIKI